MAHPLARLGALALLTALALSSPAAAPAGGRAGRGGVAIPGATPEQTASVSQMNAALAPLQQALVAARSDVVTASLATPRNDAALHAKLDALRAAELALAQARADNLAHLQATPDKLTPAQLAALAAAPAGGRGGPTTNPPAMNSNQAAFLTQMTGLTQKHLPPLTAARNDLTAAAFADPRDDAAVKAKLDAVITAEAALSAARADALARFQATPDRLSPEQLAAFAAAGGVIVSGTFSEPRPYDFSDHAGYVSLFDGKTLKGWDGNPKFWRVQDGAIVGESTPQNPSGNTYIVCRDLEAKDFTLKLEIKVEGTGGSGIQYRSKTGVPWLTAVQPNVIANAGPTNLDWMMTGPQADFWPSRDTTAKYSGQFYSENTPMRIMAWRGQVVQGTGMGPRTLMGNIADRTDMAKFIKLNDWNEYIVIARGGTFIHIINGQLMAVMIDDDPTSSNNQSGLIGIEIEATTKVSVRNVWIKKIN